MVPGRTWIYLVRDAGQGYRDSRERDYRRPERNLREFRGRDARDARDARDPRMDYPPPRGRDHFPGRCGSIFFNVMQ